MRIEVRAGTRAAVRVVPELVDVETVQPGLQSRHLTRHCDWS